MSANAEKMAQAKANWQMYLTLTQELLKFIDKEDIDEFLDLVRQRKLKAIARRLSVRNWCRK